MYRSEIITRPDGSSYMQCVWYGEDEWVITSEHELTAEQLRAWSTTE